MSECTFLPNPEKNSRLRARTPSQFYRDSIKYEIDRQSRLSLKREEYYYHKLNKNSFKSIRRPRSQNAIPGRHMQERSLSGC
jgi:hypothetical protein